MPQIVILGSTGSIGTQALEVAAALPAEIQIVGLAAGSNAALLREQIRVWQPEFAVLADEKAARELKSENLGRTKLFCGAEGLERAATWPGADMILGAMLGAAGLGPTLAAIEAGKDVAIANKETLVAAGEIVMEVARRKNVRLYAVDSEHSAIAQCLSGEDPKTIQNLTITASGGPFWGKSREEIAAAGATAALKHPTWTMGRKITIDSATLMNKGLEMIEAHWLFEVPMDKIEVVVHRQSIIHSFVTFSDNSVKAQLGVPDMKLPIQWALLREKRLSGSPPALNLAQMGPLTFEAPDSARFPSIDLARHAMKLGGSAPAALNAANEIAVQAFLDGKTNFYGVTDAVAHVLERHENAHRPNLDEIFAADTRARHLATEFLAR